jgi:hypothetical protein
MFSRVVARPKFKSKFGDFLPLKKIILIILCGMPWYRKMTCDNTMGKCSMVQSMQYVKVIKYSTYMVHKIFI